MFANIKVDSDIRKIAIPDGWFRLPNNSRNDLLIKEGDMCYFPNGVCWHNVTNSQVGSSVNISYAVIRKKPVKKFNVDKPVYKIVISDGWEKVVDGKLNYGDKFFVPDNDTTGNFIEIDNNTINSNFSTQNLVKNYIMVIRKKLIEKESTVVYPDGWCRVESGKVIDGDFYFDFLTSNYKKVCIGLHNNADVSEYKLVIRKKQEEKNNTVIIDIHGKKQFVEIPTSWHVIARSIDIAVRSDDLVYNIGTNKWGQPLKNFDSFSDKFPYHNSQFYFAVIRANQLEIKKDVNHGKVLSYKYKDANSCWWTLNIYYDCKKVSETEKDFYEGQWTYILVREDGDNKYKGQLLMHHDEVPGVSDVMSDIMVNMTHLTICFTKYPGEVK